MWRRVDLGVGPAEGDQGVIAQVRDHAGLAAAVQPGAGLVVDGCGGAERGGCDQRPGARQ